MVDDWTTRAGSGWAISIVATLVVRFGLDRWLPGYSWGADVENGAGKQLGGFPNMLIRGRLLEMINHWRC